MRAIVIGFAALLVAVPLTAQNTFDIYFIDVEGGQATLYVSPTGESLLVDTGFPGHRDNARIRAALMEAGVSELDYLLTTHYHGDHMGGLHELAQGVPVRHFIDHGPSVERRESTIEFEKAYAELHSRARRSIVKPGEVFRLGPVEWRIVSSAGEVLKQPLAGSGQRNHYCPSARPEDRPGSENPQSVGSVVSFGEFRTINLGDLPGGGEFALMCPVNRIGPIDLYLTSHHGIADAGNEMLVHAIRPRAAVMNNGSMKGGSAAALQVLHASPGLDDLWQLHWSYHGGIEYNAPGIFIANLDDAGVLASTIQSPPGVPGGPTAAPPHEGPAHMIKVSARSDGSFTVSNTRNGFSKTYPAER